MKANNEELTKFKAKYGLTNYKIYIKQSLDYIIFVSNNRVKHFEIIQELGYDTIREIGWAPEGYFEIRSWLTLVKRVKAKNKIILIDEGVKYRIFDTMDDLKLHALIIKIAKI